METKRYYNYGGYLESKVLEYDIDNNDLQILSYIAMIYASDKMEMINYENEYYVWLKVEKIVEDNPRLRIKKRALETRIAYLVDKGLIKKVVKCDDKNIKKTYFRITDKYREMLFSVNTFIEIDESSENENEIETNIEETLAPKKNEVLPFADEIFLIFNYWNEMDIHHHRELTEEIEKVIKKALKENSVDEIKLCINRYNQVIKDERYFFNTKWTLVQFLKQKNAMNDFKDDGSKWQNYINSKQGKKAQENQILSNVQMSKGWFD